MSFYKTYRAGLTLVGIAMSGVMAQQGLGEQCEFSLIMHPAPIPYFSSSPDTIIAAVYNFLLGGGLNYTGTTTCNSGATCVYVNDCKP
jgi:hypothetical protein